MALPKHKHSHARRNKRRSHLAMRVINLTRCPQCGQPVRPHRVCASCGTYRGRQVVTVAKKGDASAS